MNRKTFGDFKGSINFYLSHVSEMSFVVLQLFPNLAPHKAGCISPLINETESKSETKNSSLRLSNKFKLHSVWTRLPFTERKEYGTACFHQSSGHYRVSTRRYQLIYRNYMRLKVIRTKMQNEWSTCSPSLEWYHHRYIILPNSWIWAIIITVVILQIIDALKRKQTIKD